MNPAPPVTRTEQPAAGGGTAAVMCVRQNSGVARDRQAARPPTDVLERHAPRRSRGRCSGAGSSGGLPGQPALAYAIVETEAYLGVDRPRGPHVERPEDAARRPDVGPAGTRLRLPGLRDARLPQRRHARGRECPRRSSSGPRSRRRGGEGRTSRAASSSRRPGPGRLCRALSVGRELSGASLAGPGARAPPAASREPPGPSSRGRASASTTPGRPRPGRSVSPWRTAPP